ncbi:MAG: type II toxin-antitoxin system RelE/ParE family toxin [Sporomusaceae bacterium]|jgi:mRNA-degrading endonuclease RelE of RelBE toxin-antitoxin system|nr:type II toxin-antitoxin system RelE/ParE family toxin [Sporomusaceae bacterium]
MNIAQKNLFKKAYKKLSGKEREQVNQAIQEILADPLRGEEKKGDLAGIRVHKFPVQNQLCLLAYEVNADTLLLLALGVHENFYRDLKKSEQ